MSGNGSDDAGAPRPAAASGTAADTRRPARPRSFASRFWLRLRASKWLLAGASLIGLLVLFGLFLGGLTLFDWTESTSFCSSCHVMKPEVTAYHSSPHARVDCGTCHIGPGAIPAVQAKLASVRYLWEVPTKSYPVPIPSPIESMRPVEVVCEQCHWPQKFYEDRLVTISNYGQDESNSLTISNLLMKTGGGAPSVDLGGRTPSTGLGRGIHWHIDNPVYYIATDKARQDIPWVQATFNGQTTEYLSADSRLTPEQIAGAEKRKMDCIDCHNRATHVFQRPDEALDSALSAGTVPADLPYIKREGTKVLEQNYKTEQDAATAIAGVENFYKTQYADLYNQRQADVKKAVAGLQSVFDTTVFPFMTVNWQTHPNNIGHKDSPGCFRCHDGKHVSADKQAIRLECNVCHGVPQVTAPGQPIPLLPVSKGPEPDTHKSTTWLSEHRVHFDATCATCHTVENPGGDDNSSFCSNSACHGAEWKFAGLSAPAVRQSAGAATGTPPAIPHPISERTDCALCHAAGKVRPWPENHANYTRDMCTQCHQPAVKEAVEKSTPATAPTSAATAAPAPAGATTTPAPSGGIPVIPHELAGRADCLVCHNPEGGIKPAPQDHVGRTNDTCQNCHKPASTTTPAATTAPASGTGTATPAAATAPAATAPAAPAATTGTATAAPAASGSAIPSIPHELTARDNCLLCHAAGGPATNVPADHAGRTNDTCQGCHKPAA